MTFRRDSNAAHQWQTWLHQHLSELLACGVPGLVLEDRHSWLYFLDHGYFTPVGSAEAVIDVDRMPKEDTERLCLFLEQDRYHPESAALNRLQYLLKRGRHAEAIAP